MSTLTVGKKVPAFSGAATGDRTVGSDTLAGRWYVLYFYPKDNTPGCTQEGQDFRDLHGEFAAAGAEIVGVSRDSVRSHENFSIKFAFPFPLLSDPDETVCRVFDVIRVKKMYGRETLGVERSTFLVDDAGVLRHEWRGVKVKGHAAEVLQRLRSLKAS